MAIKFVINGATTVIPGVYSTFTVSPSLLQPAAPARDVLIMGEASEGVPGASLDIRGAFFTDYQSVKDFFRDGPVVSAARQIFSNQPSSVFGGAVNRLYVYKTNATSQASKIVASPSGFGSIVAARYGERGNQIKSQIVTGQSESLPTKTINWLPSPAARSLKVVVNGVATSSISLSANARADALVTALSTVTGLSATGGAAIPSISSGPMTADLTASGDTLTIARASGTATWGTSVVAGQTAHIPAGSTLAGVSNENAGSYIVVSATTTSLSIKRLKSVNSSVEVNASAFSLLTGISVAAVDVEVNDKVTLSVSASNVTGAAATLEVLENTAARLGAGLLVSDSDLTSILADSTSSIANISATVPSAGSLKISLSAGSWTSTPKAGDLVRIAVTSLLAGATKKNAGLLMVTSASAQSITCAHLFSGMTTEAVSSVALNGANSTLLSAAGWVSSSVAARRIDSSAERKVQLLASRASDGASFPTDLIGGNVALELGYWHASATAATATINAQRVLTIQPTGSGLSAITVNTRKYATLQELVDFLNTQANVSARIPDARLKSLSTSALDMVTSLAILDGQAVPAWNGRVKKDYSDWKAFLDGNFGLLSFKEGGMTLKAGLPDDEADAGYLTGGAVGGTSNASIQAALDAALKVDVSSVVSLFSRDASKDIDDALTDTSSTWTIDSVNAAVKSHVSTASSALWKKERIGQISFDGSLEETLQKVAEIGYERCQMAFQRPQATDSDGTLKTFLPWMESCAVAAGRAQAPLGTSLLRKPLLLSDVSHPGDTSLYTDSLINDFDPDDRGQLEEAIAAGLLVLRAVPGFGVRMESPDLSTRSRDGDPTAWVFERVNVLNTSDEVIKACRQTLENFIGNRTSDTPTAVVKAALERVLTIFIQNGSLLSAQVTKVVSLGNQYQVELKITPVEALEAIVLIAVAERSST